MYPHFAVLNSAILFQVKFSELTIDMFRMLQTLEREPLEDLAQIYDASPAPGKIPYVSRTFEILCYLFLFNIFFFFGTLYYLSFLKLS